MQYSRIRAAWVWLRRAGHCRGFGIQSPWAYRFVRYVVNEHDPYYAYSKLQNEPHNDWLDRKMGRLFLRLSNFWQPQTVVGIDSELQWRYVNAGCKAAQRGEATDRRTDKRRITVLAASDSLQDDWFGEQNMLVVKGIGCDRAAKRLWQQILDDRRATVTFDLYGCGIAFFDGKRFKQNYVVNF